MPPRLARRSSISFQKIFTSSRSIKKLAVPRFVKNVNKNLETTKAKINSTKTSAFHVSTCRTSETMCPVSSSERLEAANARRDDFDSGSRAVIAETRTATDLCRTERPAKRLVAESEREQRVSGEGIRPEERRLSAADRVGKAIGGQ
ncbi:hypothetical protein K0M31_003375 [Melipona bicolor]|uniref:Uncharacterized protein n=1 Tax=Melipona bicolor TaxID=60889 RepID=A0AA40FZ21_9HYME|nr:hypothetical protein K0M31_003375 [Melipona bicolor]